jgi:hypothetical protein
MPDTPDVADRVRATADAIHRGATKLADLTSRTDPATGAVMAPEVALRRQIARAKRLPAHMADRLKGSTREDLENDADAFLAALGRS